MKLNQTDSAVALKLTFSAIMESSKYLEFNVHFLKSIGMWRQRGDSGTSYSILWGKILLVYFYIYVIRQLIQLTLIIGKDAVETTKNFTIIIVCFISAFKVSVCTNERSTALVNSISKIEKQILTDINEEHEKMYHYYRKYNHVVNIVFVVLAYSTTFLMFLRPVAEKTDYYETNFTEYPKKPLPFSVWYPFNKYKYYSIVYAEQVFDGFVACHYTACADTLFFSLIIFAIAQLKILCSTIENFPQNVNSLLQNENRVIEESVVKKSFKSIIISHQSIIK